MASHRAFSGQIDHLSGQIKFGQTNLLYIISGKFTELTKEKMMSRKFSVLIMSTGLSIQLYKMNVASYIASYLQQESECNNLASYLFI